MNKKLKIGILGLGNIGKKHAEIVLNNDKFQLVAVIDIRFTIETAEYSHILKYRSLEEFFKSTKEVDLIAICTPNGLHFEAAKEIISRGINVIIEKPLTLNSTQAEHLKQLAETQNVHLFPVMQNRFSPPAIWLKDLLRQDVLGHIYLVQISCFWNRNDLYYTKNSWRGTKELDGGTLYTQFSHYLDIMLWLFGDITNIKSKFADFNHKNSTEFEDSGIVTFDFCLGGMGSFSFSTSVFQENLESSLTLIAENGSVKVGGQYMNEIEKCVIKNYEMPCLEKTNSANDYGSFKGSAQNHQFLYHNIYEVLSEHKICYIKGEESVTLIKTIEKIYNSK